MNYDTVLTELKNIFSEVTKVSSSEVPDHLQRDESIDWDSINHLQIILKVEENFQIKFSISEARNLNSLEVISRTILEKKNDS